MKITLLCSLSVVLGMMGCATKMTVKPGYDFSAIQRISMGPFQGQGGSAISNEFIRQLVGTRVSITEQVSGADVVLSGSVTEYKPGNKLLVFLGESTVPGANGQTVVVTNPVVSLSGSGITPEGAAMGLRNTQVVSVSATVGVIAQLKDAKTGDVVWADSYSYEGLDTASATESVISSLVKSLRKVIPALQ